MKTSAKKNERSRKKSSTFFQSNEGKNFFVAQPKLNIGQPGDKYEQEADKIADEVVNRKPETINFFPPSKPSDIQTKPLAETITPLIQKKEKVDIQRQEEQEEEEVLQPKLAIQRQEEEEEELQAKIEVQRQEEEEEEMMQMQPEEEEEELQMQIEEEEEEEILPKLEVQKQVEEEEELQMKGENGTVASNTTEQTIQSSKGGGSPLDKNVRSEMESGFGVDFSGVKVHTDSTAVQMNKDLGAQAFTTGNDIYFNEGKYNPNTIQGKRLLGHELTHTVQQGASGMQLLVQRATASESLSQIEEAASGLGTDENAIFRAIRECSERNILRSDPRVQEILNDELSGYDLFKAELLLKYGPESNFPPGILTIWEATDGAGTNEELVYDAIRSSTNRGLLQRSTWVQRTLRNEMSGHDYAKTQLLFRYGTESSFPTYINSLWNASFGAGTNEGLLFDTLIALTPTQRTELSANTSFVSVLRNELSGSDLQRFNDILTGSGPAIRDDQATSAYGAARPDVVSTTGAGDEPGTHTFAADDVHQGGVGDCFFLASLAATANTNPELLRNMISARLPDGSYNVTLHVRDGDTFRPQVVNVTPTFPQNSGGTGDDTYARGGDVNAGGNTEIWVRLLEKAYAKLRGNYEEIHGGFPTEAMEAITGTEADDIRLEDVNDAELLARLQAAFTANHPATASTKITSYFADLEGAEAQFAQNNEIIGGHAYTIMSVTNDDITLRNPHGQHIGNLAVRTLTWAQFRQYFRKVSTIRIEVP